VRATAVCDHCGCRGVEAIGELMDEHTALVDQAYGVRRALASGDAATAVSRLADVVPRLQRHVRREEEGIFRALRDSGEFLDEIVALEGEHGDLEKAIDALDAEAPEVLAAITRLLDDLEAHITREDYGIFPVSVVTLGAAEWTIVDETHAAQPSFLLDQPVRPPPAHAEESPCRRSH
jgi:hemerythrin-like domain-containing protein